METEQRLVDEAWRDAFYIAWVGSPNPKAIVRVLIRHRAVLGEEHPAVRAIAGHLAFLQGDSLGPEPEVLNELEAQARRIGLIA